ncbi:hypothetical protein PFMALIP_00634 [Plasmodium falciparum MaliPS096_E11]|uniref:Uncharacterized protein n=1 Tax=Plasmodium falciparum MaliPS096_E11 TaxID=1036727 RepID=A0A024WX62_PLAFA|nr:hypothetical protein PFMALIP_00634 [Plasmodium falciparum MaliPS096_E11]
MHFKAFNYYNFAHTFLTSKYEFWVTNYVEKWCTVTHLPHICRTKKSPLFDNFHRGGYIDFGRFLSKFLVHFLDTTYKVPHFTRNNAAFRCRGFLRLCFENFNFLGVFGQGKHGAIIKKRHPIYRGNETGNSGFRPKLYNITTTSTLGAQFTCTSKHLMIMMLHTRC